LIDTGSDWGFGTTEATVGRVLRQVRGSFVLAGKAGRLPIAREAAHQERRHIEATYVATGLCRADAVLPGRRCFTPGWLQTSIETSRAALGVTTIDVMLLQEPEWLRVAGPWQPALAAAFEALEQARTAGWIGAYGISSFFGVLGGPNHELHLDLGAVTGLARSVGGNEHGLRFVQFPINMVVPALAVARAVSSARDSGLGVLGVAPFDHGRLLTDLDANGIIEEDGRTWTLAQWLLQSARSLGADCCVAGTMSPSHASEDISVGAWPPFARAVLDGVLA